MLAPRWHQATDEPELVSGPRSPHSETGWDWGLGPLLQCLHPDRTSPRATKYEETEGD